MTVVIDTIEMIDMTGAIDTTGMTGAKSDAKKNNNKEAQRIKPPCAHSGYRS